MKSRYLFALLVLVFTSISAKVEVEKNDSKPLKVSSDSDKLYESKEKTVELIDNTENRKKKMAQVKQGDEVKVHYTGKLDDGSVFDSSKDREPLQFKIGEGKLIPGFENGVIGMEVGQTKEVKIEAEKAYGPIRKEMIFDVKRSEFPADTEPKIGMQFQMQDKSGRTFVVIVDKIVEDTITLNANHPLAGKDLTFELTLEEIL